MQEKLFMEKTKRTAPMLPALYRVEEYRKETYDSYTIKLSALPEENGDRLAEDPGLQHYFPGQFNMLYQFGMGEVPISISGLAGEGLLTHTIRSVGPVTAAMSALRSGDRIGIRGPFGSSWPVEQSKGKDVVLIAGGIGLAPLRPVILSILSRRSEFGKLSILYGARSPKDILFKEELKQWKSRPGIDLYITVDKATKGWRGSVGVITKLIPQVSFDPDNAISMICGPEIMMHFSIEALKARGLRDRDIYISMERNMKCAIGFCGHCQFGPHFICKDGPVFAYDKLAGLFRKHEI